MFDAKVGRLINLHATTAALHSFIIKSLDQLRTHNLKLSLYDANIVDLMLKVVIIRDVETLFPLWRHYFHVELKEEKITSYSQ